MALRSISISPRRVPKHSLTQLSPGASRFTLDMRASVRAGSLAFAGLLMANAAHAQSSEKWYYCDPTHAYYPYVSTCLVPWREVIPNSNTYRQPGSQQTGPDATALPAQVQPRHAPPPVRYAAPPEPWDAHLSHAPYYVDRNGDMHSTGSSIDVVPPGGIPCQSEVLSELEPGSACYAAVAREQEEFRRGNAMNESRMKNFFSSNHSSALPSTTSLAIPTYSNPDVCSRPTPSCEKQEHNALQALIVFWPTLTDSQRLYSLRQLASMTESDGTHPWAYERLLTIAEGIASADDKMREMGRPPLEAQ